jgi:hypothetical protein
METEAGAVMEQHEPPKASRCSAHSRKVKEQAASTEAPYFFGSAGMVCRASFGRKGFQSLL